MASDGRRRSVDTARAQVAAIINAKPKDIVWTSGATESDDLAIMGVSEFYKEKGNARRHAGDEHKAVLATCRHPRAHGQGDRHVPSGRQDRHDRSGTIFGKHQDRTVLVSIMFVNNEVGTIPADRRDREICRERGVCSIATPPGAQSLLPIDVMR